MNPKNFLNMRITGSKLQSGSVSRTFSAKSCNVAKTNVQRIKFSNQRSKTFAVTNQCTGEAALSTLTHTHQSVCHGSVMVKTLDFPSDRQGSSLSYEARSWHWAYPSLLHQIGQCSGICAEASFRGERLTLAGCGRNWIFQNK